MDGIEGEMQKQFSNTAPANNRGCIKNIYNL